MVSCNFVVHPETLMDVDIPGILYQIYGYAIPIVILAVLYGFRWKVGMWGNCVSLGAVLFSALVAIGWWEDVAELLVSLWAPLLFIADCLAVWLLFLITLAILDTASRYLSTIKVKYNEQVENVGNGIVLFLLFLALWQFHIFANDNLGMVGEHAPPVASVEGPMINSTIGAIRILSAGDLSGFTQTNQFDDRGNFLELHLQRRQAIMNSVQGGGDVRADEGLAERMKRQR